MKQKSKKSAHAGEHACECGGRLQATVLKFYDFSAYAGFHVVFDSVPGFRCANCEGETVDGGLINILLKIIVVEITKSDSRLSGEQARFLRRVLGSTQQELATRMGVVRETVANWERNHEPISAQHDLILRVVVLSPLLGEDPTLVSQAHWAEILGKLRAVRTSPPSQLHQVSLSEYPIARRKRAWGTAEMHV
jgi:DNA-binding transcriptional regulator YiaG